MPRHDPRSCVFGGNRDRPDRPQTFFRKRVGVETAPVDFHAQHFLQPDIAKPDLWTEIIEKRKLAGLSGSFEHQER